MRILANENVAGEIVEALRQRGHDVAWAHIDAPGSSDSEVLRRATDEERLIVTFDKDFGELAFRSRLPAASGIVLLRLPAAAPSRLTSVVVGALESREDWSGQFSVVEPNRIRMTALPQSVYRLRSVGESCLTPAFAQRTRPPAPTRPAARR